MTNEAPAAPPGPDLMPRTRAGLHIGEAISILFRHLGLFSALILTVWLPGNILMCYLQYRVFMTSPEQKVIRLSGWYEVIFGPIYIGAMVYALSKIRLGETVRYRDAVRVGISKWGSLFSTQFLAGLIIGLGLIALIIPGLLLLVRYALISPVVILEGESGSSARKRSTRMTEGRRNRIFLAGILLSLLYFFLTFVLYMPAGFFDFLDGMSYDIIVDSILDVLFGVFVVLACLFYWEAKSSEPNAGERESSTGGEPTRVERPAGSDVAGP